MPLAPRLVRDGALVALIGVHVHRGFGPFGGFGALPHRLHPLRGEALIAPGVARAVVVTARLIHPRRRRRVAAAAAPASTGPDGLRR